MKKVILLALAGFGWAGSLQGQTLNNNEYLQGKKADNVSTINLIGVSPANNIVIGTYGQAVISPYGSIGFNTTNLPNYPQLRFEGGGYYFYKLNSDGSVHSYVSHNNADFNMAYKARGSGGRAIVHDGGNRLTLNYGNDFTGGTRLGDAVVFGSNEHGLSSYIETRLGVGRSAPEEALHVNGLIKISGATAEDNNSPGIVAVSNDDFLYDGQYVNHYGFGFHNYNDGNGADGRNAYISGHYGVDIFSGGVSRIRVNRNGNVGIGTTTPGSFKLAVEGKIGAHEIKVTTAGWADFVFKDDYVLRPLTEVEQFIQQNGHLPDVPSEAEVLEHGIELGAMDAKLLQKIEELTLYTLEQQKALEKQQAQIQILIQQNQQLQKQIEQL